VTLSPGESTTVLLTVTSPQEIPLQDYRICVEATSSEDHQMTASLDLIASSKAELVVESLTVNCEERDITLTAFVSNVGLQDAENIKIQFFRGPPSENDLLGEHFFSLERKSVTVSKIEYAITSIFRS
jgi:uncharacterized membrane protein